MNTETCEYCGEKVGCATVGTGGGVAHPDCYEMAHPPRIALTAWNVICGMDDPVLSRQLIQEVLTPEQGEWLVNRFNHERAKSHARRVQPPTVQRHCMTFDEFNQWLGQVQ